MPDHSTVLFGYCECGCGQLTSLATRTSAKKGHTKGQPHRFILGHRTARLLEPPLVEPTTLDDAWAAGILDGEGSVQICRHGTGHKLTVVVGQSSATKVPSPMLTKLQSHYGGYIIEHGGVRGARRNHHIWGCSGFRAESFLRRVQMHTVQKRGQVAIALEYRERALGRNRSDLAAEYSQRLKDERKRL